MNVSFIGSGNVATHLAMAFYQAGFNIEQICSHTEENAKTLASQVGAGFLTKVGALKPVDLVVVSVKDDAIALVLRQLKGIQATIVHTSGATPLNVFNGFFESYGVLYPLQTFSKSVNVDFKKVPLCIEAVNDKVLNLLITIGKTLSNNVRHVSSEDRKQLHLAAVFACNFTNHMYAVGKEILEKANLSFDLLIPLIEQSTEKIKQYDPKQMQTGPAVRGDQKIMKAHMELLKDREDLKEMYDFLSKSIKKMHS